MNDVDIFLNAVKAANDDNPILNTLTPDGVAFIDYKNLGDRIIDGIKINSCIRLKTLPSSGFVGSRKIFYTRLNLSKLYPFIDQVMVLVSDHADIRELLKELGEQAGIFIDPTILVNNLDDKLIFDSKMCGKVTLKANPKSIYIEGEIDVKYTCNKNRVLNYVKNRVVILSEAMLINKNITDSTYNCVAPIFYYCDAGAFPPDHDIFVKYDCLAGVNRLNIQRTEIWVNDKRHLIEHKSPIFDAGNLPTYFRCLMEELRGNMEKGKEFWKDYETYNFRQVVHAFLKWFGQDSELGLHVEDDPKDGGVYYSKNLSLSRLDMMDFYYIGKTIELVNTIKNDPIYKYTVGNCGVNINFNYVCAFRINNSYRYSGKVLNHNDIITIYWG